MKRKVTDSEAVPPQSPFATTDNENEGALRTAETSPDTLSDDDLSDEEARTVARRDYAHRLVYKQLMRAPQWPFDVTSEMVMEYLLEQMDDTESIHLEERLIVVRATYFWLLNARDDLRRFPAGSVDEYEEESEQRAREMEVARLLRDTDICLQRDPLLRAAAATRLRKAVERRDRLPNFAATRVVHELHCRLDPEWEPDTSVRLAIAATVAQLILASYNPENEFQLELRKQPNLTRQGMQLLLASGDSEERELGERIVVLIDGLKMSDSQTEENVVKGRKRAETASAKLKAANQSPLVHSFDLPERPNGWRVLLYDERECVRLVVEIDDPNFNGRKVRWQLGEQFGGELVLAKPKGKNFAKAERLVPVAFRELHTIPANFQLI